MNAQLEINFAPPRSRVGIEPGSQNDCILQHLLAGESLTPLGALELFDCLRLGGRIHELRELGYAIETEIIELPNKKRIAQYSLKGVW